MNTPTNWKQLTNFSRLCLQYGVCPPYGSHHAKTSSGICEQRNPRSACTSVQSDKGLRCSLTESSDTMEYTTGEQMPGVDFAHARNESESVHNAYSRRHIYAKRGPYETIDVCSSVYICYSAMITINILITLTACILKFVHMAAGWGTVLYQCIETDRQEQIVQTQKTAPDQGPHYWSLIQQTFSYINR